MSLLRFQKKFRTSCKNRLFSTAGLLAFRRRKPALYQGFPKVFGREVVCLYVLRSIGLMSMPRDILSRSGEGPQQQSQPALLPDKKGRQHIRAHRADVHAFHLFQLLCSQFHGKTSFAFLVWWGNAKRQHPEKCRPLACPHLGTVCPKAGENRVGGNFSN